MTMTPGEKSRATSLIRQRMRIIGYEDGLRGAPKRYEDETYLTSHRRGRERAAEMKEEK